MNHPVELKFVRELLKTYRLNLYLFDDDLTPDIVVPEQKWIGELLTKEASLANVFQTFKNQCKTNTIYQIEDGFFCHHMIFLIPMEDGKVKFAYLGPYTQEIISKQQIAKLAEKYISEGKSVKVLSTVPETLKYREKASVSQKGAEE